MSASINACDDGNTISGDGCSSTCQVEDFYSCNNDYSPSVCIYKGAAPTLSLNSIRKNGDLDQGTFVFDLLPDLLFLNNIGTAVMVALDCAANYTASQTTYSGGKLTLIVDYTTDMEGVGCNLTINYNLNVASLLENSISFNATSNNQKLVIADQSTSNSKQTLALVFRMLSYVAIAVFLVSLRHKMIGL
jgi:cysteine-rich repeat protein